jgi:hypothetical protein
MGAIRNNIQADNISITPSHPNQKNATRILAFLTAILVVLLIISAKSTEENGGDNTQNHRTAVVL